MSTFAKHFQGNNSTRLQVTWIVQRSEESIAELQSRGSSREEVMQTGLGRNRVRREIGISFQELCSSTVIHCV